MEKTTENNGIESNEEWFVITRANEGWMGQIEYDIVLDNGLGVLSGRGTWDLYDGPFDTYDKAREVLNSAPAGAKEDDYSPLSLSDYIGLEALEKISPESEPAIHRDSESTSSDLIGWETLERIS